MNTTLSPKPRRVSRWACLGFLLGLATTIVTPSPVPASEDTTKWVRTAQNGRWSEASTWEGGRVPEAEQRVHIRLGHAVVYDLNTDTVFRTVFISGKLVFDPSRDTRMDVGLLRIENADTPSEEGFDCEGHIEDLPANQKQAALIVGSPNAPIYADKRALIRLVYIPDRGGVKGHDKQSCPAIVCCGGRMDFHGAPLNRTWVKLGATANKGSNKVTLSEGVRGWRAGDQVIITATHLGRDNGQGTELLETEERTITGLAGDKNTIELTLDKPLLHEHLGEGEFRGEVANLSRNVIVESADPNGVRGHTMYHRGSQGSLSYAEFRHLGKKDVLGRYSLHYHLVGDTMRGSSVIGVSIHDSHNRWLTIHGTNHLVVRDCVGCRSIGHGFYLEDGTEVDNILDRNMAVQAMDGKRLPQQVLPFDHNEGSGFWWANSLNTFTRNVTCENNRYGYRFEATETSAMKLKLRIRQPDGSKKIVDIRTLPFVRFADNEAHCDGLYGLNLGEGVNRVGPDEHHPFVLRNTRIWEIHYAFRVQSPSVKVEGMTLHNSIYGVYHPNFDRHAYHNLTISRSGPGGDAEPFNRGHDDDSIQYGSLTVDGLTFAGHRFSGMPLIQLTDDNPTGKAESHFRNVSVIDRKDNNKRALIDLGGGPQPEPKTATSVPVFLHDYYGQGEHARVVSRKSGDYRAAETSTYKAETPLTGEGTRVAHVKNVAFPKLLDPVDDLPPTTVITHVTKTADAWLVRGSATDNNTVKSVVVNGLPATSLRGDYSEWECRVPFENAPRHELTAQATDAQGLKEPVPHFVAEFVRIPGE